MYSKVAARWWTDAIRLCAKRDDTGETEKMLETFQDELENTIRKYVEGQKEVYIVSQFRPDAILSEVAGKVGMDQGAFAMKAFMIITERSVRVRAGYSKSFTTIYCNVH